RGPIHLLGAETQVVWAELRNPDGALSAQLHGLRTVGRVVGEAQVAIKRARVNRRKDHTDGARAVRSKRFAGTAIPDDGEVGGIFTRLRDPSDFEGGRAPVGEGHRLGGAGAAHLLRPEIDTILVKASMRLLAEQEE